MSFTVRPALPSDVPVLLALIDASVRELQAQDYTLHQRECALADVYGIDSQLIADGTYFVVETAAREIVGCGGWSKRRTLCGGDQYANRDDSLLHPPRDAAKIRAFFVHPRWARQGVGSLLLVVCEEAALAAGFRRLEMGPR